jgi:hypothetical protein
VRLLGGGCAAAAACAAGAAARPGAAGSIGQLQIPAVLDVCFEEGIKVIQQRNPVMHISLHTKAASKQGFGQVQRRTAQHNSNGAGSEAAPAAEVAAGPRPACLPLLSGGT